jgi:hypothetical protein
MLQLLQGHVSSKDAHEMMMLMVMPCYDHAQMMYGCKANTWGVTKTPLYPNCNERYTKLSASLKLLQLKVAHHWTKKGFRELLEVLRDIFPKGNHIPRTTYEAKKIVCLMGLKFEKIHACKNDYIIFRGDNVALTKCPKCGTSCYK